MLQKFSNYSDEALLTRLEYGKLVTDAVTTKINDLSDKYMIEDVQKIFDSTLKSDCLFEYFDSSEHPKLTAIDKVLREKRGKSKDNLDSNLVALCLKPCDNLEK